MTAPGASPDTIIDLIRHGEPVGGRRYRGQTDDPLSEKGWAQMRAAVGEAPPWQAIVSSTLSRCLAFARELSERHQLPLESDPRFMEIGFGSWEGCTPEQLTANDPQAIERFRADPIANRPAGAEALADFATRVGAAWHSVMERHAGRHVLIVAHAGVIRAVIGEVLEVPLRRVYRISVPTAGISRIRVRRRGGEFVPELLFHAGRL